MRSLLSIGRFSELTGLGVRALRLYEAEGLLRPAVVDARTGYRFYRWHQRADAERIRALRDLDVPLDLVGRCLREELSVADVLALHEARLEQELASRARLLAEVRRARLEPPVPEVEVGVRFDPARPLISLTYRTALSRCEADRREAYLELRRRARRLGTGAAEAPFALHPPEGGFVPDDYLVKVCLPVRDAVEGSEPGRAGLIAFARLRGDLVRLGHVYRAVSEWVNRSPYVRVGPSAERYLCRLKPGAPPHTEVWQPVRLKEDV